MKKKNRPLKIVLSLFLAAVLLAGAYAIYVFAAYHRIEDNLPLTPTGGAKAEAAADTEYRLLSWNIGFAAYSADFTFFMDGGEYSRAYSKQAVLGNLGGMLDVIGQNEPDFLLLQEVDLDSTRSYHTDERQVLLSGLDGYDGVYAVNYDSPYLLYPLLSPHGSSKSALMTLSSLPVSGGLRRSLPVESGFMKLIDLDRCYTVTRIPLDGGRVLCLYDIHLSAYTSDGTITTEQFRLVLEDMLREYGAGNYAVCGGDFNKDLLINSGEVFGVDNSACTWAQPIDTSLIPDELTLIAPLDESAPTPSCRNADIPYEAGVSTVLTVDGFIVSGNVDVTGSGVIDTGFAYSDHNPVSLTFRLS